MKKIVLITGSHGEIAQNLGNILENSNYSVRFLTRKKTQGNEFEWNVETQTIDIKAFEEVTHIIHLAGAGIAGKPWTKERKQQILSSRVDSARLLLTALKNTNTKIDSFISASAIGYYGSKTTEKVYSEEDSRGTDFLSEVCYQWEKAADDFLIEKVTDRVVKIRIGVVLSKSRNGALERMKTPIMNYTGACLGSGKQYIPWIHISDLCAVFKFCLDNENINGVYNAVSPESVTNKEFTQIIAQILHKPILLPAIPGFMIKWIFREMAVMLLEGSRVSSAKIRNIGFVFQYPELRKAIESLLKLDFRNKK